MKVVVIGGDAAGMSGASQIKRQKPDWDVIVFERGQNISYAACGMPYYIEGLIDEIDNLIELTPEEATDKRNIDLRLNHEITGIDPIKKTLTVKTDSTEFQETYDRLLIATGARPNTLFLDIEKLENVFTINNLNDAKRIKEFIKEKRPANVAIVGGGYIGLEMTEAIAELGINTSMIHRRNNLNRSFEQEISDIIKEKLIEKGVTLTFGSPLVSIEKYENKIILKTEEKNIKVDAAILATGVIPECHLASEAGIELDVGGTIKVNDFLETSEADIFAAGDCAAAKIMHFPITVHTPLALKANKQGMLAGINIAGGNERFPGINNTAITKIFDLAVSRTGLSFMEAEELGLNPKKILVRTRDKARYYPGSSSLISIIIVNSKTRMLLGAQMAGTLEAVKRIDVYSTAMYNKMTIDDIFNLDLAYAPPFSPVYDPVIMAARVARKNI